MRRTRTFAVLAAVTVLGATIAPTMMAYVTYGKWGSNNVSFYVNPANSDVSQNAAIAALQAGMSAWNTESGTPLRFSYAGQVNDTTTGYDQKNVILFRNESSGPIASTYSWIVEQHLVDADVIFGTIVRSSQGPRAAAAARTLRTSPSMSWGIPGLEPLGLVDATMSRATRLAPKGCVPKR